MNVASIMTADPVTVARETKLDDVLELLEEHDIRHLPVVEDGELVGVVSDRDLLEATGGLPSRIHACRGPEVAEKLPKRVAEILRGSVATVGPETEIAAAAVELLDRGIGCLPVVRDGTLVGMLTERDLLAALARNRVGERPDGRDATVADRMTADPATIDIRSSLGSALELCRSRNVRHLPVLQAGQLIGIVSDRDLRRELGRGRHEDRPVAELLTREPRTVTRGTRLSEAVRMLAQHAISALPVVEAGACVGILTVADVLQQYREG